MRQPADVTSFSGDHIGRWTREGVALEYPGMARRSTLRRIPLLVALLAVTSVPPASAASERFDAVRERAESLPSLAGFLERYVGECREGPEKRTCEENVLSARRIFSGKALHARVGEVMELLRVELRGSRFRIFFTPFIDGGRGYALTHGAPTGQDAAGRPRIPFLVLEGTLPPEKTDLEFQGPFRTGNVELEVVFRPEGTWKMRRRDAGHYQGVKARFLAVRLVDPRSGAEIASRVLSGR